jgi:hypothetical protein
LEAQAGDEILAVRWISLAEIQSMPDEDCVAAPVLRHAVEDACDAGPLVYREIDLSLL